MNNETGKNVVAIWHKADLDGICSGAIIKLRYPDATFIGYDYGEPFDFERIKGKDVIMADVSLSMPEMEKVAELAKSFIFIDHHVSTHNDLLEYKVIENLRSVYNNKLSACELTWIYLFMDKEMPRAVELLGKYDSWRNEDKNEWDNEIMPFQWGMR